MERLDRLLSRMGYCSRSEARHWVRDGRILVDGVPVKNPGQGVAPQSVTVDDEVLDSPEPIYLLYHKAVGTVCAHHDPRSIYGDFPSRWSCRRPVLSSVGRLDKETSGVLLLSDDGHWLQYWSHPRRAVQRQYRVTLAEPLIQEAERLLAAGTLQLEGESEPCKPAELQRLNDQEVLLTLQEGRYHEVRRMMAALGNHVVALHRERFGPWTLGALPPGAWQRLHPEAIQCGMG